MRQILEKMDEQMMEGLSRLCIFLSAIRAIPLINHMAAVEAGLVLSDRTSRHKKVMNFCRLKLTKKHHKIKYQ